MQRFFCPLIRLALGIAAVAASPASARVVGADERGPLPAGLEAQFSGVGRLVCRDPETGNRFSTTATLVGNRSTVLAAGHFGHVERGGRQSAIAPEYCAFELRSSDGKRFFGSLLAPQPVARFSQSREPDPSTPDWAIIKLRDAAPASAAPVVVRPARARDMSARVFMVSYHSSPDALARQKRYSPDCTPSPVAGKPLLFRHRCDTESGSSGGLLFIMTGAGPRAVAINHGSATERDWNYAQAIGSEIARHLPEEGVEAALSP
jgi:hypothetical protein